MRMVTKRLLILSGLALTVVNAIASDHGAGSHGDVPTKLVFVQFVNLFGLLVFFIFILKKRAGTFFSQRRQNYLEQIKEAEKARNLSEKSKQEILLKLKSFENDTERSLQQAHRESDQLKQQLIQSARENAKKMEQDVENLLKVEHEKMQRQLKLDLLSLAVDGARKDLKARVGNSEQKQLQTEFVEKIQVV
ncbi:MAG: ATP synthase F0 subunit B [Bdellovibrionales bacterium]|nr:ATP synthase F0 subunit B [Bdellovibrionales bacterium]